MHTTRESRNRLLIRTTGFVTIAIATIYLSTVLSSCIAQESLREDLEALDVKPIYNYDLEKYQSSPSYGRSGWFDGVSFYAVWPHCPAIVAVDISNLSKENAGAFVNRVKSAHSIHTVYGRPVYIDAGDVRTFELMLPEKHMALPTLISE